MKTEVIYRSENVTLTTYINHVSPEMPYLDIRPAILVLPGGAYAFCSDREAEPIALEFVAKGYNAFVLRYSLKTDFSAPLEDAQWALKLIRDRAEEFHIDPNKVAAIGFSAGGHLTAALSTISDIKPDASILGYPCTLEAMNDKLAAKGAPSLNDKVTADTPPTFIISASDDSLVPIENSLEYGLALRRNGVPFEMHVFAKGEHGFATATETTNTPDRVKEYGFLAKRWIKICIDWLNFVFSDK